MFSTFTGASRRPRNVNLSGQAGNPFSNTSWSPSSVSNATKTVSNAQADREKRQAERQRLKAAEQIQRTWRGHRARSEIANARRDSFDKLYSSGSHATIERLHFAFNLLLSFFSPQRHDDIHRLFLFARDCSMVDLERIPPSDSHPSRMIRFVQIMAKGLDKVETYVTLQCCLSKRSLMKHSLREPPKALELLKLTSRIISASPSTLHTAADGYYTALAGILQYSNLDEASLEWLANAFAIPLTAANTPGGFFAMNGSALLYCDSNKEAELQLDVYKALAFCFLVHRDLHLFEGNVSLVAKGTDSSKLSSAVLDGYAGSLNVSNDQLLWLLAHYIDLGSVAADSGQVFDYLEGLHMQLSALSSDISIRLRQPSEQPTEASPRESKVVPLEPYVSQQLLSLVDNEGISRLLRDLSDKAVTQSSERGQRGTSLLAGYTSTLLLCFPDQADDIRMRLFLATIPTQEGEIPTPKFLWQDVRRSTLFRKLVTESERPVDVLRNYIHGTFPATRRASEEREWRVVLMFLELYIFVLRLSDDDDFFSGINPELLQSNQQPSRIRACSLSLEDLKSLTTFLKNAAFALHYKAREIASSPSGLDTSAPSRLDSYLSLGSRADSRSLKSLSGAPRTAQGVSTRLGLESLRELMTTAIKMLYERDSRKQFLPPDHWLTDKLEGEDFINAVLAEYDRQMREDVDGSDIDSDDDVSPDTFASSRMGAVGYNTYARMERMRINQRKVQRERRLAEMGPKLEILKHMPFVVPFETRVNIFRQFIALDRAERSGRAPSDLRTMMMPFGPILPSAKHHADIRRGKTFEDAFENFYQLGDGLKDTISITFVDQFGAPEAGIDGGGVTKEFLTSVTTEAFSNDENPLRMFICNEKGLLFPDPIAVDGLRERMRSQGLSEMDSDWKDTISKLLKRFEFLGRIVGKCLYEGILVDLVFAGFFLLKWPSTGPGESNTYKGSVNDLRDMDEELYKGMLRLKNYPGDVSELGIDFTINDQISPPGQPLKTTTRNLIPNGDKMLVTNDNRLLYISYVARHRLVLQPALQTSAFLRGLRQIIRPSWLSMFNQSELQRLVGGDSSEIDIDDLRRNTVYGGLYVIGDDNEEHPTVKLFWKVMRSFTDAQRRDVLKYVSSTPRAPLLGFSQLNPKFSIRDAGRDETRLPSTSTCVNLLKLPQYTSEATMREKLLYAITSGAGFDLS